MVGPLVRVHLRITWRTLTSTTGRLLSFLLMACYVLGGFAFLAAGILVLSDRGDTLHGSALVVGFSLLVVMWPFMQLFVTGVGQTVDPGRFALFGLTARDLMPGQLAVAMLGPGALFASGCSLVAAVSWWGRPAAVIATVVGSVLGVLTGILACRVLATSFSRALASRRRKDAAAVVLGVVGVAVAVIAQDINRVVGVSFNHPEVFERWARTLAWTPLGWAWAAGWDAARGAWPVLAVRLLLALALVVLLGWLWGRGLARALVQPLETGGNGGRVKERRLSDRLVPWTPAGAVAWRGLVTARRDPRRLVQLVTSLMLPAVLVVPLMSRDHPVRGAGLLVIPAVAAWTLGMTLTSADTSQDGNALWLHVVAGLSGRDDRRGRLLSAAVVGLPLVLVVDVVFLAITGQWRHAPATVGVTLGLAAASAGVGSVTSAYSQVAVPPPGQNTFGRSSGGGMESFLVGLLAMLVAALLAGPLIGLGVLSAHHAWLGWLLLVVAPAYGLALAWGGTIVGGRRLDATWPEVLRRVTWEKA